MLIHSMMEYNYSDRIGNEYGSVLMETLSEMLARIAISVYNGRVFNGMRGEYIVSDTEFEEWRRRRNEKVAPLLESRTPAWLLNEQIDEELGQIQFDLVHRWPVGVDGWTRRHYTYEVDVDVLHYRGETPVSAAERAQLKPTDRFDLRRIA